MQQRGRSSRRRKDDKRGQHPFFYLKDASMQTVESTTNIKKEGEEEKRGERDQSMQVCRGDGAREKEIERERVMGAGSEAKQRRRGREV